MPPGIKPYQDGGEDVLLREKWPKYHFWLFIVTMEFCPKMHADLSNCEVVTHPSHPKTDPKIVCGFEQLWILNVFLWVFCEQYSQIARNLNYMYFAL